MEDTYTNDALVQFLYHEMSAVEAIEMAHAIEADDYLLSEFRSMQVARAHLVKVLFQPSAMSVNRILRYSAGTALETGSLS